MAVSRFGSFHRSLAFLSLAFLSFASVTIGSLVVVTAAFAQTSGPASVPTVPAANPMELPTPPSPSPVDTSPANASPVDIAPAGSTTSDEEPQFQPAPLVLPDTDGVPTANYSDDKMSVDYPDTWLVEIDPEGMVSIQNSEATPQAVTQVFRVAAPPGPLVNANIDSFVEEGATVKRYSSVTIDEQDALVIWLSDRPDELSNAIATFIGYGNETVFLFSRYLPTEAESAEPELEDSLLRLHSSFANLETDAAAVDSAAPSPESTTIEVN